MSDFNLSDDEVENQVTRFANYFRKQKLTPKEGIVVMAKVIVNHVSDMETLEQLFDGMRECFKDKINSPPTSPIQ